MTIFALSILFCFTLGFVAARALGGTPDRDRLVHYRQGWTVLAAKKCLPEPAFLVKARDVPAAQRLKLAERARVGWIRAQFAGYHCPDSWLRAVAWAQGPYPGTSSWLLSCSASEGGHGRAFWNGGYLLSDYPTKPAGSSGALAWLQFMHGTFTENVPRALGETRARGYRIPRLEIPVTSWYSPLGQALTGASMLSRGLRHHWVGAGC